MSELKSKEFILIVWISKNLNRTRGKVIDRQTLPDKTIMNLNNVEGRAWIKLRLPATSAGGYSRG
ncbi:MAG: hypothetical protein NTW32_12815 [Chloroflexi bacterium]|nr:hypothetical protein [Chloroflexota bacterium]